MKETLDQMLFPQWAPYKLTDKDDKTKFAYIKRKLNKLGYNQVGFYTGKEFGNPNRKYMLCALKKNGQNRYMHSDSVSITLNHMKQLCGFLTRKMDNEIYKSQCKLQSEAIRLALEDKLGEI